MDRNFSDYHKLKMNKSGFLRLETQFCTLILISPVDEWKTEYLNFEFQAWIFQDFI